MFIVVNNDFSPKNQTVAFWVGRSNFLNLKKSFNQPDRHFLKCSIMITQFLTSFWREWASLDLIPPHCVPGQQYKRINPISKILLINMHSNYRHLLTPSEWKTAAVLSVSWGYQHIRGWLSHEMTLAAHAASFAPLSESGFDLEPAVSEWQSRAAVRRGREGRGKVREGDREKMTPCVCSHSAACERLLRGTLRSPVFHFLYPPSFLSRFSLLFVHFLWSFTQQSHCLCPQPAEM